MYHILVIEDEPLILSFVSSALERLGYQVYTAQTGEKGLEICQNHTMDLVLVDHWMSGLSGAEVVGILQAQYPGTKTVLMTGEDPALIGLPEIPILRKPFSLDDLTSTVELFVPSSQPEQ